MGQQDNVKEQDARDTIRTEFEELPYYERRFAVGLDFIGLQWSHTNEHVSLKMGDARCDTYLCDLLELSARKGLKGVGVHDGGEISDQIGRTLWKARVGREDEAGGGSVSREEETEVSAFVSFIGQRRTKGL